VRLIRAEGDSPKSWHLFAHHFSENACGQMQLDALMIIEMFDCNYKHVRNIIIASTRIYARLSIFESEIYQNEPNMYNTCTCAHASIQQCCLLLCWAV